MISFVLKSANLLIISKLIVKVFFPSGNSYSLLFILSLGSLGFFAGILLPIAFFLHRIPSIWLGNSRLNGGQPSKFLKHKLLSQLKNGSTLKSPQKQRLLFGLNLYQTLLLGPKLLQKIIFLQIRHLKRVQE